MSPLPPWEVKVETVHGCGADLQICSLLDRQQFSDPDALAEAAGIMPSAWAFFGLVWPSSRVLAHRMASWELNGQRILEVGCGLALASLVLHRRRGDVTASDCHPLVPSFLERNLLLNGLGAMPYVTAHWGRSEALGRYDLIIGSDVLYEHGHAEILSSFIAQHVEADGQVVLVDPNRGHRSHFSQAMNKFGFGLETENVSACPGSDEAYRGRILNYRRG